MVPISDPLQRPSELLEKLSQLQQSICPIRLFTRPSSFKSAQQRRPARKVPRQRPSPSRRLMPVARKRSRLQLFHPTSPPPSPALSLRSLALLCVPERDVLYLPRSRRHALARIAHQFRIQGLSALVLTAHQFPARLAQVQTAHPLQLQDRLVQDQTAHQVRLQRLSAPAQRVPRARRIPQRPHISLPTRALAAMSTWLLSFLAPLSDSQPFVSRLNLYMVLRVLCIASVGSRDISLQLPIFIM